MKQITIYILFLLCFFNLEAKTESLEDIKKNIVDLYNDINSLTYGKKDVKYEPDEVFIYHAVWPYGKEARQDYPWPWGDGRVKAGKYRASKAAMDKYIEHLKEMNGQKLIYSKKVYVPFNELNSDIPQNIKIKEPCFIFLDEKGDSIIFRSFLAYYTTTRKKLLDEFKKLIGLNLIIRDTPDNSTIGFFDKSCGIELSTLPFLSEWKVSDVDIDDKEIDVDDQYGYADVRSYNSSRIRITLKNDVCGEIYCFAQTFHNLISHSRSGIALASDLIDYSDYDYSHDLSNYHRYNPFGSNRIPNKNAIDKINEWASKGDPAAMFTKWMFIDYSNRPKKARQENPGLLLKAAEHGHYGAMIESLGVLKDNDLIKRAETLYDKGYRSREMAKIFISEFNITNNITEKKRYLSEAISVLEKVAEISNTDSYQEKLRFLREELKKLK